MSVEAFLGYILLAKRKVRWSSSQQEGLMNPVIIIIYLFDIMKQGMTPEHQFKNIRQTIENINKHMDVIFKSLEIERKVTTYLAPHSYTTISEALGHCNVIGTQKYLESFW